MSGNNVPPWLQNDPLIHAVAEALAPRIVAAMQKAEATRGEEMYAHFNLMRNDLGIATGPSWAYAPATVKRLWNDFASHYRKV